MCIVPVRVIAPRDNDCFFHVVAYFLGEPIVSWEAAKKIRMRIAEAMADELLTSPWNDLTMLTAAVLSGVYPLDYDPPALKTVPTPKGAALIAAHQRAPRDNNNVPANLIEYIVWVQFSALEVDRFYDLYGGHFKPLFRYTIWGEEDLATTCVELLLNMPTAMYAAVGGVDVQRTVENTLFIESQHCSGAEYWIGRSCINFLGVEQIHFDAVEFYKLSAQELILESFQSAQASIPEAQAQPLKLTCPYRLASVTILDGEAPARQGFVKWVNLPCRPAYMEIAKSASRDQFGTQLRIRLEFEAECESDRALVIKLIPKFEPVERYIDDDAFRRLPTPKEYAANKHYGWTCFSEAAVPNHCAEQVLVTDSLDHAAPLDQAIRIVAGRAKTLILSGLFLPACAGIRYQVQVTGPFDNVVMSDNCVSTRKMLFYNPLVSTSLDDHSKWFAGFEAAFRPFFLDFCALPGAPRLTTSVVCDADSNSSYEAELKAVSKAAEPYYPYFFNLALIESFSSYERRDRTEEIYVGKLLAQGQIEVTLPGLDLSQLNPVKDVFIVRNQPTSQISLISGVSYTESTITVKLNELHKQRLREHIGEMLEKSECEIALADEEYKSTIKSLPDYAYRMQAIAGKIGITERDVLDLLFEENLDLRRRVLVPDALIAKIAFTGVAFKVDSSTAGYYQNPLKSCTIPVKGEKYETLLLTVIHEVGHVIGLAPNGYGPTFIDKSPFHYRKRGHHGPHCYFGIDLLDDYKESGVKGKCVMFGSSSLDLDQEKIFCPHCASAIVLADLSSGYMASKWNDRPDEEIAVEARKAERIESAGKLALRDKYDEFRKRWQAGIDQAATEKQQAAAQESQAEESALSERYSALSGAVNKMESRINELTPEEKQTMRQHLEDMLAMTYWEAETDQETWEVLLANLKRVS